MKVALLADMHVGCRNGSMHFHRYFKKIYDEVFFPELKKRGITNLIQFGDVFDSRSGVQSQSLYHAREYFFDKLVENDIETHIILGNHDIALKQSLKINSPSLLLGDYGEYNLLTIYDEPARIQCGDLFIDLIPWICDENREAILEFISQSKSDICIGHFELNGFKMDSGQVCNFGLDKNLLKNYKKVYSGHFHNKSSDGNISYLGTIMELTWADHGEVKGFHILDTDTMELEFIKNPYTIHEKTIYNDAELTVKGVKKFDFSGYADKFVKVIVEEKNDPQVFDAWMEKLLEASPIDIQVLENYTVEEASEEELDQTEDTPSTLRKYVDGLNTKLDKDRVKDSLIDVYQKALEIERSKVVEL